MINTRRCFVGAISDVLQSDNANVAGQLSNIGRYCHATVETNWKEAAQDPEESHPLLAVLSNLLQRGQPTRTSYWIEERLAYLGLSKAANRSLKLTGEINFEQNTVLQKLLSQHLPFLPWLPPIGLYNGTEPPQALLAALDSDWERTFYAHDMPRVLGTSVWLVFQPQATKEAILHNQASQMPGQRMDFVYLFPKAQKLPHNTKAVRGIVVELDGPTHDSPAQRNVDRRRDAVQLRQGLLPFRISYADNMEPRLRELKALLEQIPCWQQLTYGQQHWATVDEPTAKLLLLTYVPFGVARLQKAILSFLIQYPHYISEGLSLHVIERDMPFAHLAVADLQDQYRRLALLAGSETPEIHIALAITPCNQHSAIVSAAKTLTQSLPPIRKPEGAYHLVLDLAIWGTPATPYTPILPELEKCVEPTAVIRTAWGHDSIRPEVLFAKPISFKPLGTVNPDGSIERELETESQIALQGFLRDIFRKDDFRTGQLEILNRALQRKTVIGLLPTGGGKSLTYQLAVLLQPGVSLIIDPLKSLMLDQHTGLERNYIHCSTYLNSSVPPEISRQRLKQIQDGCFQLVLLSPERMLIPTFRNTLKVMEQQKRGFVYGVIDEAHCVSEWGHDFRTSYLRLGDNLRSELKTLDGSNVSLFGLTATASFDVLADVQRELQGLTGTLDDEAVVRPPIEDTQRRELCYRIIDVKAEQDGRFASNYPEYDHAVLADDPWTAKALVAKAKDSYLIDILTKTLSQDIAEANSKQENEIHRLPDYFPFDRLWQENGQQAGIIFMPHGGSTFGVTDQFKTDDKNGNGPQGLLDRISWPEGIRAGGYRGGGSFDDNDSAQNEAKALEEWAIKNQRRFLRNDLNLMVATKAFGMGIDKPNVRTTIHYCYPSALESLVQEAGRAGRDRKQAVCYVLYNEQAYLEKPKEAPDKTPQTKVIDKGIHDFFQDNNFKGVAHEVAVLKLLMDSIKVMKPSVIADIEQKLSEEMGVGEYGLSYFEPTQSYYINHPQFDAATKLWFNANTLDIGVKNFPDTQDALLKKLASLLNTLRDERAANPNNMQLLPYTAPGISHVIYNMLPEVAVFHLDIPFSFDVENPEKYPGLIASYGKLQAADIFRAVYRLTLAGIVEDFTVDYNSKTIRLKLMRRNDSLSWDDTFRQSSDSYLHFMFRYFSRYDKESRVIDRLQEIESWLPNPELYPDKSVLDKQTEWLTENKLLCLCTYLIEYTYTNIVAKRKRGVEDVQDACKEGIAKGSEAFAEYLDLYFNSKYARKGYQVEGVPFSLLEDTHEGREWTPQLLEKYIVVLDEDKSGSYIDNLKHLRGAAQRLLRDNPENPILLLLKAFALVAITLTETQVVKATSAKVDTVSMQSRLNESVTDALKGLKLLMLSPSTLDDAASFDSCLNIIENYQQSLEKQLQTDEKKSLLRAEFVLPLLDALCLSFANQMLSGLDSKLVAI